ncbi:MAG: TRAP transporter TatT component family protein [Candidatus Bipolaricaulota bacterium]|nr:TRAP transporter TatT component family protein [Candidatus Bipolaricaulota bacterium]
MRRKVLFVGLAVVLASSCLAAASDMEAVLAQAAALYDTSHGEFDFAAYEGQLREAIRLYEEALPLVPADEGATRLATLHQLARAYFELANAYIPTGPDQEAAYVAGKDHALASLRLDPDFVAREAASFRDALANANDVEGVFWYGTNFGCYLNYHQLEAILSGGMRDVPACYERAMALDETYLAGAPLRSLGCYLAQVPSFIGGDLARARELLNRAIAIAPEFLQNAVDLSEWVLKQNKETQALCTTLQDVKTRAQDPAIMSTWPLYNELSLRRAESLSSGCP